MMISMRRMTTTSSTLLLPSLLLLTPFFFLFCTMPEAQCARRRALSSELHFMRKLFYTFEHGGGIPGMGSSGAIVGYAPTIELKKCSDVDKGSNNNKNVGKSALLGWALKFALKKLAPGERYVRAELHLYTRGRLGAELGTTNSSSRNGQDHLLLKLEQYVCDGSKTNSWPDRKIRLELAMLRDEFGTHQQHMRPAPGWSKFDAITPLMYAQMDELGELYINFLHNGKPLDEVHLRRFMRNYRPFLIVYMDTTNMARKGQQPAVEELSKTSSSYGREKREVRATMKNYGHEEQEDEDIRQHMDTVRANAEYYSYGMAKATAQNNPKFGLPKSGIASDIGKLKRRRKQKIRKGRKPRYPGFDPNDPMLGFGTPYSPWERIPHRARMLQSPNTGTSLNDIRSLRKHAYRRVEDKQPKNANDENVGGHETKLILLEKESSTDNPDKARIITLGTSKCALHNMTMDFRDLGWSDRIIAPKRFEAGFCTGHCNYPLEQDSNPTNHAILQSLMAASQLHQHGAVPATHPLSVCCAPASFDSLTLLYFDEWDNVVLKNYPKMVVLSCGCL